ncbi:hypothetical protein KUTeg_009321 [Tegillarca granosa]|uniref:Uncharacterized protein n=1 Tax=Tegillarca granosa TaxID=220873 RepID=A0ABQ9F703_TEGGR|nr:hypothetical protein KUTeg_009321 [Tegillarca granosa]
MMYIPMINKYGKYFLVRDVTEKLDKNKSYDQYRAPNVHRAKGGFPVYSSGQPTERGLITLLDKLVQDSFTEILLFNLREEPVLFVDNGSDKIPHSIRDQVNLHDCVIVGRTNTEADEAEARVRKEVKTFLYFMYFVGG